MTGCFLLFLSGASKGQPVIRMTSCSGDIGILTVQFHGGAAWIYNLLKDIIWIPVKNSIQDIVSQTHTLTSTIVDQCNINSI